MFIEIIFASLLLITFILNFQDLYIFYFVVTLSILALSYILLKNSEIKINKYFVGVLNYKLLMLLILFEIIFCSYYSFNFKPIFIDDLAQFFQAKIFSGFQTTGTLNHPWKFFSTLQMIYKDQHLFSQYPPGNPILISIGILFGFPNLIPILCSVVASYFIYKITEKTCSKFSAEISLLIISLSPFFIINSASFMNHTPALMFASIAFYSLLKTNFYISGLCWGLLLVTRPLDAICLTAGFLLFDRNIKNNLKIYTGGLIPLLGFLFYNKLTTGEYLLTGYSYLWGQAHNMGFHINPFGYNFTIFNGIYNQLYNIGSLNYWLIETTLPCLLPLIISVFIARNNYKLILAFLIFPICYAFYWHNDRMLGPRFLFTALIFLIPILSNSISIVWIKLKDTKFSNSIFILLLVIICFGYFSLFTRFNAWHSGQSNMKIDLPSLLSKENIKEGIIFIKTSFGERLISKLQGSNLSASEIETIYNTSDHCSLNRAIKENNLKNVSTNFIKANTLNCKDCELVKNGDPSLRLPANLELDSECLEEIKYDQSVYTTYAPYFKFNDINFSNNLLIARDLREQNKELIHKFNLPVYIFDGELIRVVTNPADIN